MAHKNQHWIPQSYLKAWCDPTHRSKVIHTYKSDGSYDCWRPPSRIFSADDLYTIRSNGQRDLVTERLLNRIEDLFSKRLMRLVRGEPLRAGHQAAISLFVAAIRNRSPRARDHWQSFKNRVVAVGHEMEQAYRRATPEERNRMRAASTVGIKTKGPSISLDEARAAATEPFGTWLLRHIKMEADALDQLDLFVLEAPEGIGFITSDNPVVWYDSDRPRGKQGRVGLDYPGIEVTMPLSPRLCALFSHSGRSGRGRIGQPFVDEINARTIAFCDERFVANSSELVVEWSD